MADLDIPENARQFLLHGVDSIAEWEAVLLLRESPNTSHDAASLADRLYIGPGETATILQRLVDRGIVQKLDTAPATFIYKPSSVELGEVISICADLYRRYLIPVTRIIHTAPKKRLRAFADAFRIRND